MLLFFTFLLLGTIWENGYFHANNQSDELLIDCYVPE